MHTLIFANWDKIRYILCARWPTSFPGYLGNEVACWQEFLKIARSSLKFTNAPSRLRQIMLLCISPTASLKMYSEFKAAKSHLY